MTYEFDNDLIVGDTFYGVIGSVMVKNMHRNQNCAILDFLRTGELVNIPNLYSCFTCKSVVHGSHIGGHI